MNVSSFSSEKWQVFLLPILVLFGTLCGLVIGTSNPPQANILFEITMILGMLPLVFGIVRQLLKGNVGVDIIALVAIATALLSHEYLAGCVILLMLSGGEALEGWAAYRSTQELKELLSRAPSLAHRLVNETLEDIEVDAVNVGDVLIVKAGEVVPVDAVVEKGTSDVDESSITGESIPVSKSHGNLLYSGSINKDSALTIRATKISSQSQYQRIVALVREAEEHKAPLVRLADRYAGWFTLLTFAIALGAWIWTQDPIRFLAVLVVATPCPLILATPIAIISGMSKSASRGIIVKHGGAIEKLGEAHGLVFDKTGTLTLGQPIVSQIISLSNVPIEQILWLSASLDQLSLHAFARSLVAHANTHQNAELEIPEAFSETFGNGVIGTIAGTTYRFGKPTFLREVGVVLPESEQQAYVEAQEQGFISVYLSNESTLLGKILFEDVVRPEVTDMFDEIKEHNIREIYMLTGDKQPVADRIAASLHLTHVRAELKPEDKVREIETIRKTVQPIVMIGDGINDAPAMAAADVSIALAAHGSSAASEAGDVVIMVNDMMRVHDALHIAQRVMTIAKQSIGIGIGVSIFLMLIAAAGFISPLYGAIIQEILDVAVIFNVLRINFEKI